MGGSAIQVEKESLEKRVVFGFVTTGVIAKKGRFASTTVIFVLGHHRMAEYAKKRFLLSHQRRRFVAERPLYISFMEAVLYQKHRDLFAVRKQRRKTQQN